MKDLSFANKQFGIASTILGAGSLIVLLAPIPIRLTGAAVGLVGLVFGILSVRTKAGALGMALSLLPIMYLLFILTVSAAYRNGS